MKKSWHVKVFSKLSQVMCNMDDLVAKLIQENDNQGCLRAELEKTSLSVDVSSVNFMLIACLKNVHLFNQPTIQKLQILPHDNNHRHSRSVNFYCSYFKQLNFRFPIFRFHEQKFGINQHKNYNSISNSQAKTTLSRKISVWTQHKTAEINDTEREVYD